MTPKRKRIETDEQYAAALKWLTAAALELEEDPSLKGEEREKQLLIYERTSLEVQAYNARQLTRAFPFTRSDYEQRGLIVPGEEL